MSTLLTTTQAQPGPHRLAKYLARIGHPVFVLAAGAEDSPKIEGNVHRVRGEFHDFFPVGFPHLGGTSYPKIRVALR